MLTRLTWLATSTPSPRAWRYKPQAAPAANSSTESSTSPYTPGQPDTNRPRARRCLKGSNAPGAGVGRLSRSALEAQDRQPPRAPTRATRRAAHHETPARPLSRTLFLHHARPGLRPFAGRHLRFAT